MASLFRGVDFGSITSGEPAAIPRRGAQATAPRLDARRLTACLARTREAPAAAPSSSMERLPSSLFREVLTFLDAQSVLRDLLNVSRSLRGQVVAPGALRSLRLQSPEDADRAAAALPADTWGGLVELRIGAAASTVELEACLNMLGPRLRALHMQVPLDRAEGRFAAVPARVWSALETFDLVLEKPLPPEFKAPLATGRAALERKRPAGWVWQPMTVLKCLGVSYDVGNAPELPLTAHSWADNASIEAYAIGVLEAAAHGELRTLSFVAVVSRSVALARALAAVASTLEVVHLRNMGYRSTTWRLPPLPRVHTLVLRADYAAIYELAATPHRALRHLYLQDSATLEVAPGRDCAVEELHSLVFDTRQSDPRLLALLEPACDKLRLLAVNLTYSTSEVARSLVATPVQEHVEYRLGSLLARASATLEELVVVGFRLHPAAASEPGEFTELRLDLPSFGALHTLRVSRELLPPPRHTEWERVWEAVASLRTLVVLDHAKTHKPQLPLPDRLPHPILCCQCDYRTPLPRALADAPLSLHSPSPTPLILAPLAPPASPPLDQL